LRYSFRKIPIIVHEENLFLEENFEKQDNVHMSAKWLMEIEKNLFIDIQLIVYFTCYHAGGGVTLLVHDGVSKFNFLSNATTCLRSPSVGL